MPAAQPASSRSGAPTGSTPSSRWPCSWHMLAPRCVSHFFLSLYIIVAYVRGRSLSRHNRADCRLSQVMDAFLSNKSCFLAEKPWKQVMDRCHPQRRVLP